MNTKDRQDMETPSALTRKVRLGHSTVHISRLAFGTVVLDAFGPDRLMFGSDWPFCTLAARYDKVVAAAISLTAELSESERDAIFNRTASRVYGLST